MVPPIAVSAPRRVAERLRHAADGPVSVLHHSPAALYVEIAGRCVGVVAPGAARVPCALRLSDGPPGVSSRAVLAAVPAKPYVERGTLLLAGNPLLVGRFVDVRVPRIALGGVLRRAASPTNAVARPPRPAADGLAACQAAYDDLGPRIDAACLDRLVGHGGGLTPLGDDVLCGWLAVLHATDRLDADTITAVRGTLPRTTMLSATLLDCALHGEVLPELATYLSALGSPGEDDAARALHRIGHTSGSGLWWGARHALATLTDRTAAA